MALHMKNGEIVILIVASAKNKGTKAVTVQKDESNLAYIMLMILFDLNDNEI